MTRAYYLITAMALSRALLATVVLTCDAVETQKAFHTDVQSLSMREGSATSSPVLATDIVSTCGSHRPTTHLCDPEHTLSDAETGVHARLLQQLAAPGGTSHKETGCVEGAFNIYVALIDVPAEGAKQAASELGRRWGVLGSQCGNGVVALYSTRDRMLAISADKRLEQKLLTPQVEDTVERSSIGLLHSSPQDVVTTVVSKLENVLDGKVGPDDPSGMEMFLYVLSSCLMLAVSTLVMCCMYDTAANWLHRARFLSCERKVQRVHEVFLSRRGELPLCPHCVEFVSNQPSPSTVVFLCGHRFHMDCANRWFVDRECKAGCCPICEGGKQPFAAKSLEAMEEQLSCRDESKCFILRSLHKQYPEIISNECCNRWADCHTEIWLSELSCPRYYSIFNREVRERNKTEK